MRDAYISDLSFALGERSQTLDEAAAQGLTRSSVAALREAGFERHHICAEGTSAYRLATQCLEPLAEGLRDADAIVYSTCLPQNASIGLADAFAATGDVKFLMDFPASHLQRHFSMDRAQVFGLTQQACTGVLGSLRLARMLLQDDPAIDKVLCVTADRFPRGAHYEQGYNLISDGAAACIVSSMPQGFRILAAHGITNGALAQASDDEVLGSFFSYAHRVIQETVAKAGLTLEDIDWIVPQNTHRKAWQILGRLMPFDAGRIASPTIGDVGHVISADNIINLKHLIDSDRIRPGEKVLLFMAGYGLNWQCVVLEKEHEA
jgi:3-oxoacyl-[acyl-carrier-protein] synthase III